MIRKSLAVLCCFSLLGQNTLYASADKTNPAEQKPQTLAEYQQRAKEDIQRTPWINREGKYILALGGVSAGALIIQQVRFHHKQMAQQKNWERERIKLAGQNAEEVAFLQQKLGASQAAQREAEKELLATRIGWEMHEQVICWSRLKRKKPDWNKNWPVKPNGIPKNWNSSCTLIGEKNFPRGRLLVRNRSWLLLIRPAY